MADKKEKTDRKWFSLKFWFSMAKSIVEKATEKMREGKDKKRKKVKKVKKAKKRGGKKRIKEDKGEKRAVNVIFMAVVILLIGLGVAIFLAFSTIPGRITGGTITALTLLLFLTTIKRIPFPEVRVIDRLGILIEKRPGYRIIVWFFGIEKTYLKLKAELQYPIPLFSDRKDIVIDLKKGGRIILKDPRYWILIHSPKKTAKTALDFEEQIREMAENRVAGILNNLTYDEVVAIRIPEAMRNEGVALKKKLDILLKESEDLQKFLEKCGIEYIGFTLDDFDFDENTTKKRGDRITAEMDVEIAKNVSEARKNEMSAIAETAEILQKDAGFPPDLAQKTASERYQDHLVGDKGKLQKVVWIGDGNVIGQLASQWELGGKLLGVGAEVNKKEVDEEEVGGEATTKKEKVDLTEQEDEEFFGD